MITLPNYISKRNNCAMYHYERVNQEMPNQISSKMKQNIHDKKYFPFYIIDVICRYQSATCIINDMINDLLII